MTLPNFTPPLELAPLRQQLADAGYDVSRGIGMDSIDSDTPDLVYTWDDKGDVVELDAAQHLVDAFLADARGTSSTRTRSSKSSSS